MLMKHLKMFQESMKVYCCFPVLKPHIKGAPNKADQGEYIYAISSNNIVCASLFRC